MATSAYKIPIETVLRAWPDCFFFSWFSLQRKKQSGHERLYLCISRPHAFDSPLHWDSLLVKYSYRAVTFTLIEQSAILAGYPLVTYFKFKYNTGIGIFVQK